VILQGQIVAGMTKASLVIRFLYNGLYGEFRQCRVTLTRGQSGNWQLLDAQKRTVPLVVVKTWALLIIGTVGIETLQGICTAGERPPA
jgi:hypothetical protein